MKTVKLGGDRIGSGNKLNVSMHGFERSTHDLSYLWRSSMANGTLVPFMNLIALPGDTFDIKLNADVKTLPTLAPLFGSFKLQLDVYSCPLRLYNRQLHNNKLGIGLEMNKVKFPTIKLKGRNPRYDDNLYTSEPIENFQINQSSLLSYLGIRGIGTDRDALNEYVERTFNSMPILAYWDIYKNYYANKQEGKGMFINNISDKNAVVNGYTLYDGDLEIFSDIANGNKVIVYGTNLDFNNVDIDIVNNNFINFNTLSNKSINANNTEISGIWNAGNAIINNVVVNKSTLRYPISVDWFDLKNIDTMREEILGWSNNTPFNWDYQAFRDPDDEANLYRNTGSPYVWLNSNDSNMNPLAKRVMHGLGLKTYQSDLFNNWLNTEWIDGENGISAVTAIDTTSGSFTMDTLNISKKVYDMLNRIAVSGGTYDDWLEAVYDHDVFGKAETPIYMGGLSQEIVFQQVVSTAGTSDDPLGSLAGRGNLSDNRKGGNVTIKVSEPSLIIGIVSITPRIDYSQGNDWTMNLQTMDDLHKPSLDEIGFQELITEQMAWFDTTFEQDTWTQKSAGKQPAWINYMTNFNKTYGEFANPNSEMFMTLNRRYEYDKINCTIKDLTTYIDPQKFNYIFANADLNAQNFWVQIASDVTARRKLSAKLMPNL